MISTSEFDQAVPTTSLRADTNSAVLLSPNLIATVPGVGSPVTLGPRGDISGGVYIVS